MKFKKVRRKDYETQADYLDAILAENWWQVSILYTIIVAIVECITYFQSPEAFVAILIAYAGFVLIFNSTSKNTRNNSGGNFMASPFSSFCFFSIAIILLFIASFFA